MSHVRFMSPIAKQPILAVAVVVVDVRPETVTS